MPDDNTKFPPLPEVFTDKLKSIDPDGCRAKQLELEDWWLKVVRVLQQG